jgi:nitrite reductase/ring-hydroxylating ferredoxin subunit/uncharacterized membrane protein
VKHFLQGRWLGHPLHPLLVHFPVGLFVTSLLFDLSTYLLGSGNTAVRGAFYTMVGGLVMAVLAAVAGLADWSDIRADHPARRPATTHLWLNVAVVGLYAINLLVRWGEQGDTTTDAIPFVLSLASVGILSFSGYLGGTIVYDDGVGVGRHRRKTGLPGPTVRLTEANGAVPGEYVALGKPNDLAEGETLRVEVAGTVAVVARVGGEFYAFQEFCTHRFGPLSEGAFEDGQVRCPWHNSCFDIRSGAVTNGPAKLPVKVYEVRVQDDRMEIRVPDRTYPGEPRP